MARFVKWQEPLGRWGKVCIAPIDDVIAYQTDLGLRHDEPYINPDDALMDFMAVHFADIIEV
jgi:hypothetical protein